MICIEGKTAFSGIAIGPIREFAKKSSAVRRSHVDDTAAECTRFEEAKKVAMEELGALYDKAVKEVGEDNAAIFEVHQMMLDDEDYCDSIRNIITTQEVNAEFAVATTGDNFAAMFAGMDDEYMKARSADVKDISERLIAVLHHGSGAQSMEMEQAIILADDLAPSETIQLDRSKVLAFVTREGSTNSHTAILARTMNIPALVCTPVADGMDGKMAIVDGMAGKIIIEPEESVLAEYQKKKEDESKRKELLSALKGKPTATKSGKSIKLYANIGGIGDITVLPKGCSLNDVFAFDTGPGNMVMDALAARLTEGKARFDDGGRLAAQCTVNAGLLAWMMQDPYLSAPPPKTTGREVYGAAYVDALCAHARTLGVSLRDTLSTATRFTAECIREGVERFCPQRPERLIVGGGGSMNPVLLADIADCLPGCQVLTNEQLGLDSSAKEAVAFAVLANEALYGCANNAPGATGAAHGVVMGKISL